jgi:hypothetical protein
MFATDPSPESFLLSVKARAQLFDYVRDEALQAGDGRLLVFGGDLQLCSSRNAECYTGPSESMTLFGERRYARAANWPLCRVRLRPLPEA